MNYMFLIIIIVNIIIAIIICVVCRHLTLLWNKRSWTLCEELRIAARHRYDQGLIQ